MARAGVLLASAARTADVNTATVDVDGEQGLIVYIDCTASAATPSVVFTIQGYNEANGEWYTILASAAVTGAGDTVLRVHPAMTASANAVAADILPRQWRVNCNHSDTDSITYSVGYLMN